MIPVTHRRHVLRAGRDGARGSGRLARDGPRRRGAQGHGILTILPEELHEEAVRAVDVQHGVLQRAELDLHPFKNS